MINDGAYHLSLITHHLSLITHHLSLLIVATTYSDCVPMRNLPPQMPMPLET